MVLPKPWQRGQAPKGLLKLNRLGSGSANSRPQRLQANFSLKRSAARRLGGGLLEDRLRRLRGSRSRRCRPGAGADRGRWRGGPPGRRAGFEKSISSSDSGVENSNMRPCWKSRLKPFLRRSKRWSRRAWRRARSAVYDGEQQRTSASRRAAASIRRRPGPRCRARRGCRTWGSRCGRRARRAGAGNRRARWRWRRWSAGCAWCSSAGWRPGARCRRSRRRPASPCAPGTGGRRRRAIRRSGAGPRRRWCRRRATICRSRTRR